MRFLKLGTMAIVAFAMTAQVATAQQAVEIDGDNIRITGCVAPTTAQLQMPFETLLWSRTGILTAGTDAAQAVVHADAQELGNRIVYWLDEDDLARYAGQLVELRGELEEIEQGELEIERDGDFTEIRLELGGEEQEIRVPTAWLARVDASGVSRAADRDDDVEIKIATRKVDVDDVKVLGPCPRR